MALKILTRGADGAPRSFFFDTVPKWGPTVFTGIMAATLVAMFVVGSVIGFAYVAPLASRSYTVVDSAGGAPPPPPPAPPAAAAPRAPPPPAPPPPPPPRAPAGGGGGGGGGAGGGFSPP